LELYHRCLGPEDAQHHVIVLHGLFAASDNLLRLGQALAETYRVHLLDMRNHGMSPHSDEFSYALMADDVLAYISKHRISQPTIVGHSMGGKVAMQVALNAPNKVKAIVVADIAPVNYAPRHNDVFAGLHALAESPVSSRAQADEVLSGYVKELGVRQFLIKNLRKAAGSDGKLAWRFNLPAIAQGYSSILTAPQGEAYSGPVLFIAGEHSDYILPEHREQTVKLFPSATMRMIPDTSHWLHAEKPDVFNAVCKRFIDKASL